MLPTRWLFALLLLAPMAASAAPDPAPAIPTRVASPDGRLVLEFRLAPDGRPGYALARDGRPVLDESRLGFILAEAPKLDRDFTLAAGVLRSSDSTWEQPWGERRRVRDHYSELHLTLREKKPPARALDVVFRVFDDGLGFRYEFPEQDALKDVGIVAELTEFAVAGTGATAWWIPAGEWNRYEYLYRRTPLVEVGQGHTPVTVRRADGLHLAFHEAALVDYSAMWLRQVEGQLLRAQLSPASDGPPVRRRAPFHTPWRTVRVADSAAKLYESDLELNLNAPNALGDVSWVKPYKYAGVWWGMHLDRESWASGAKHGATTANVKRHIDFAAKHGLRGVLVEGWNVGWDGDWFASGADMDFTRPYPDFDLEAVAAYAKSKGVHLVGHHETGANIAVYERQLGAALDLYQRLGVDSIKTGYVADAGGIQAPRADGGMQFQWHDGQRQSRHHLLVVTEAAKRHIAINPHEPIKDTGLRRTYPNWVSREGARGQEYNAWGSPPNPPSHEPTLVFTRMLSGPMDYTPGIVSLQGKGQPLQSTLARQLALYVVLYSPIQMLADLPEHYDAVPAAMPFLEAVPTDWEQSRVLAGEVGEFAVIARQDRAKPSDWYLGAITDTQARTVRVPLDFLPAGARYVAQVYRDGEGADFRTDARHRMTVETREVRRGDTLELWLAPGGGAAVRFTPAPR